MEKYRYISLYIFWQERIIAAVPSPKGSTTDLDGDRRGRVLREKSKSNGCARNYQLLAGTNPFLSGHTTLLASVSLGPITFYRFTSMPSCPMERVCYLFICLGVAAAVVFCWGAVCSIVNPAPPHLILSYLLVSCSYFHLLALLFSSSAPSSAVPLVS